MTFLTKKTKLLSLTIIFLLCGKLMAQQGSITINQSADINTLLKLKKEVIASEQQFKIQVFSGASRSDAETVKSAFDSKYSDISSSLEYETPNYKIWVGNFRNRLEADRALLRIKKNYANAFIFKPKQEEEKEE